MDEELKNLLLTGNSMKLKKYLLENYLAGTREDMFGYQIIRDFLQIMQTEELVGKTWLLALATWALVIITALVQLFGPYFMKKWSFT